MSGDEGVAGAFAGTGKARDPIFLPQGGKLRHTAGEDLMHIALMPHIPDQLVLRHLKGAVERHRQLHNPQIGGQVSSRLRNGVYQKIPQFSAQSGQFGKLHRFQIVRRLYPFENRVVRHT